MKSPVANFRPPRVYLQQEPDDAALIARVLAGDTEAFEPLVRRYQRPVFTLALRMVGNRGDAEDIAQNTFVKAYDRLRDFNTGQRFFPWIYRIAMNACLNAIRARRAVDTGLMDVAVPADAVASLEVNERRRDVQKAILALTHDYRQVIVLRHFSDLSYDEMSAVLGIPVKTVKSRLHTARQRLAERLEAWGGR